MPSKLDKVEGVFIITCEHDESKSGDDLGMAYVGKSKGVGAAIRSAKSKLRKGAFHNKAVQEDFNVYGMYHKDTNEDGVYFEEAYLVEEGETLGDLFFKKKDEIMEQGYLLYQDVEFIKVKPEKEIINALKDLLGRDYWVIESITQKMMNGEIDVEWIIGAFENRGIEL
jgi:hypothetical protein